MAQSSTHSRPGSGRIVEPTVSSQPGRKAIHESIFQSPLFTNNFVERFILELDCINAMTDSSTTRGHVRTSPAPRHMAWRPQLTRYVKISVDGGLSIDSDCISRCSVQGLQRQIPGIVGTLFSRVFLIQ